MFVGLDFHCHISWQHQSLSLFLQGESSIIIAVLSMTKTLLRQLISDYEYTNLTKNFHVNIRFCDSVIVGLKFEPCHKKTGFQGFKPGPTQTSCTATEDG